jgi:hypothetical protein
MFKKGKGKKVFRLISPQNNFLVLISDQFPNEVGYAKPPAIPSTRETFNTY